jgi:hypothetical protein
MNTLPSRTQLPPSHCRRIGEITRRAKGVSIKTTMEKLAPYSAGLAQLFRLLRNARGADWPNSVGAAKTSECFVAAVENTTSSPSGSAPVGSAATAGQPYRQQRSRPLVSCPCRGPVSRALQCVLQIARTFGFVRWVLVQPTRTAVYGPVRTVV